MTQSGLIRAGIQLAEVFNSGLEVWLYDASHRARLKETGAFEPEASEAALEKTLKACVKEGLIMAYQLAQDDSLRVGITVGEPLTKRELAAARWLRPQRAFLRLPTGRLVVESNDALTIRAQPPTDPGAELAVPPGDYLATLYRIDWDALEADELEWSGVHELIVLTPGPKAKPVRGQPWLLPWEMSGPGKTTWSIQDGVYTGSLLFYDDEMAMCIALDPAGGEQFGLRPGSVAILRAPTLDFDCPLVFVVGDTQKYDFYSKLDRIHPGLKYAGREWAHCWFQPDADTLFCMRRKAKFLVPKKQQNVWHPAELRLA